ncbi:uncharacterized protein B0I36DRAFT_115811 [Microdochium trichocladiopsis]|uniref:Uncharacterized protein n=1 Tax=Microdochium trichocladiopsis TaxID=1682393 RepID=A0A9P8Y603_9PEZI|nr:uncharacterized protein B0I36DRAFT_115811 [Microdochium trichocladiopsis]KAH7030909.1 hypothetical protein B0I36DRAFT_115811 [Microdochium trichocladiopsis]
MQQLTERACNIRCPLKNEGTLSQDPRLNTPEDRSLKIAYKAPAKSKRPPRDSNPQPSTFKPHRWDRRSTRYHCAKQSRSIHLDAENWQC